MKKHRLVILLVFIFSFQFISFFARGQNNYEDVVYLKNGGIIHGMIIEQVPNVSIKIQTANRNVFVYKIDEISKITREPVQLISHKNLNVANKPSKPEHRIEKPAIDSLKKKGATVIMEASIDRYDFQQNEVSLSTGFNLILGYRFNPHFGLGIGSGFERTDNSMYLPVFVDMRYYILNRTVTPYIAGAIGFTMGMSGRTNEYDGGLLLNADAGIKFFVSKKVAMHCGLGYKYKEYYYPNAESIAGIKMAYKFLNLSIGITI